MDRVDMWLQWLRWLTNKLEQSLPATPCADRATHAIGDTCTALASVVQVVFIILPPFCIPVHCKFNQVLAGISIPGLGKFLTHFTCPDKHKVHMFPFSHGPELFKANPNLDLAIRKH